MKGTYLRVSYMHVVRQIITKLLCTPPPRTDPWLLNKTFKTLIIMALAVVVLSTLYYIIIIVAGVLVRDDVQSSTWNCIYNI